MCNLTESIEAELVSNAAKNTLYLTIDSYPLWYEPCSKLAVESGPICSALTLLSRCINPDRFCQWSSWNEPLCNFGMKPFVLLQGEGIQHWRPNFYWRLNPTEYIFRHIWWKVVAKSSTYNTQWFPCITKRIILTVLRYCSRSPHWPSFHAASTRKTLRRWTHWGLQNSNYIIKGHIRTYIFPSHFLSRNPSTCITADVTFPCLIKHRIRPYNEKMIRYWFIMQHWFTTYKRYQSPTSWYVKESGFSWIICSYNAAAPR